MQEGVQREERRGGEEESGRKEKEGEEATEASRGEGWEKSGEDRIPPNQETLPGNSRIRVETCPLNNPWATPSSRTVRNRQSSVLL